MRYKHVKTMLLYYRGIPEMIKLLKQERDGLKSHPGGSGRPQEIVVKLQVLEADAEAIQSCMDLLNGKYKRLLKMRYLNRYSWTNISVRLGVPDSTVRHWHERAIARLAELFGEVPMSDEILGRALRARE